MIYPHEKSVEIVLQVYEYLQMKAVRDMPHSIKMDKPMHVKAVEKFISRLPSSAGADYVWNFLTYQFYIYSQQHHVRRANPSWFISDDAFKRWREYDEGINFYVKNWIAGRKLINPVGLGTYIGVSQQVLQAERLKMSRISGPNYCALKYGDAAYNIEDEICQTCPFKKDCKVLFTTKPATSGKSIVQYIMDAPLKHDAPSIVHVHTHLQNFYR